MPEPSNTVWKALHAAVVLGTIVSICLVWVAGVPALPWTLGIIAVGAACSGALWWQQRHLVGHGAERGGGEAGYWTTRRRAAAAGGLPVLLGLAVVAALAAPGPPGVAALAALLLVLVWMYRRLRPDA